MTVPKMRMGLVGFPDEQYLRNLLMTRNRNLQWEPSPLLDADALWINGAHVRIVREHTIRIPSTDPTRRATVLNLREMDRPVAFVRPLGGDDVVSAVAFDPHDAAEVAEVFNLFEAALLPTVVDLTLAAEIAGRRRELAAPVYHLSVDGHLAAVVTANGRVGLAPRLSPSELAQAVWHGLPAAADDVPTHFRRTTMAVLMWQYAMRHTADLLPSRYRTGEIYWRRMPVVPSRLVREEHLLLIAELSAGPQTVAGLVAATGLGEAAVTQALAALYFGGSLTTDAHKAGPAPAARSRQADESWPSSLTSSISPASDSVPPRPRRARADMPTVPTPLDPSKRH